MGPYLTYDTLLRKKKRSQEAFDFTLDQKGQYTHSKSNVPGFSCVLVIKKNPAAFFNVTY